MFIIYHKHAFQRRGSQDLINHQSWSEFNAVWNDAQHKIRDFYTWLSYFKCEGKTINNSSTNDTLSVYFLFRVIRWKWCN